MVRLRPIEEQVVVVVGASSGIGRATALEAARRGARVVVSSRSQAELERLAAEIRAAGGEATAIAAEVASFEQVQAVAAGAVARYGRIDTWAHVAGASVFAPITATTPAELARVLAVNLQGAAHGIWAALPHLDNGALIVVTSVEAVRAVPYQGAYAASKHGLHGLLEALRLELRHSGARVSLTEIMPATINTPLYSKARTRIGVEPLGVPPHYHPQSVADAIVYAAAHPKRQIIVGGAGRILATAQRVAPQLVDEILLRTSFRLQRLSRPKDESAPDNLDAHLPGYDRVEGPYSKITLPHSAYTWLQTAPAARRAVAGILVGTALALGRKVARRGR
jgi:NAD(P)-dependent dehydrogenase (short-subunit alcohol dehydrogenase family)